MISSIDGLVGMFVGQYVLGTSLGIDVDGRGWSNEGGMGSRILYIGKPRVMMWNYIS